MNKHYLIIFFLFHYCLSFGQNDSIDWEALKTLPQSTEIGIGILENGTVEKYGFILKNNQLIPKRNSSNLFEIGSITKVFTTLSALRILKRKKIGITSPIVKYLPNGMKNISSKITFHKLMTHTSGFPKMPKNFFWSALRCPSDPFLHYYKKRMTRFLNKFSPKEDEGFLYSNIGMSLLGYLCSNLENSTLDTIMNGEIFQPLNMKATTLGISPEQFNIVVNSRGTNREPKRTWKFSDLTKGAGNAYSNIDDMTQFLKFILRKEDKTNEIYFSILEMEEEEIPISETESMGLGWRIHKNKSKIIYHGGITYGFKSLIAYDRKQEKGIVILTNAKGLSRKENKILKEVCFKFLEEK